MSTSGVILLVVSVSIASMAAGVLVTWWLQQRGWATAGKLTLDRVRADAAAADSAALDAERDRSDDEADDEFRRHYPPEGP